MANQYYDPNTNTWVNQPPPQQNPQWGPAPPNPAGNPYPPQPPYGGQQMPQHYPYQSQPQYQTPYLQQYQPVAPPPPEPVDLEKKHIKKMAGRHGTSIILMNVVQGAVILILAVILGMIIGMSAVITMPDFTDIGSFVYDFLEEATYFMPMILAVVVIAQLMGNTLPFIHLYKKQGMTFKSLYVSENSRTRPVVGPRSLITLSAMILAINFAGVQLSYLLSFFRTDAADVSTDILFGGGDSWVMILLQILMVCIIAPITEEIIFRGLVLMPLRRYGDKFAILISAILFGLVHGNVDQTPFAFVMGLLLGFVTVKSNSIIPATILHFINNAFATGMNYAMANVSNGGNLWDVVSNIASPAYIVYMVLSLACVVYAVIKLTQKRYWLILDDEFAIPKEYIPKNKYTWYFSAPSVIIVVIIFTLTSIILF